MKKTMSILLALSIFCTVVIAGDQQNGGLNCDPNHPEQCCDPNDPECGDGFAAPAEFDEVFATIVLDEIVEAAMGYTR